MPPGRPTLVCILRRSPGRFLMLGSLDRICSMSVTTASPVRIFPPPVSRSQIEGPLLHNDPPLAFVVSGIVSTAAHTQVAGICSRFCRKLPAPVLLIWWGRLNVLLSQLGPEPSGQIFAKTAWIY